MKTNLLILLFLLSLAVSGQVLLGSPTIKTNSAMTMNGYLQGAYMAHASYSDTTDQLCTSTTMAKAILFNSQDDTLGIYDVGDSLFYVRQAGDYEVIVSIVVAVTSGNGLHYECWFNKNGNIMAKSNTIVQIPSNLSEQTVVVPYIFEMNAGDYFKVSWHADDTKVFMNYTALASDPTRPSCPSVIMSIKKISQ